jgi:hypothetical protein
MLYKCGDFFIAAIFGAIALLMVVSALAASFAILQVVWASL